MSSDDRVVALGHALDSSREKRDAMKVLEGYPAETFTDRLLVDWLRLRIKDLAGQFDASCLQQVVDRIKALEDQNAMLRGEIVLLCSKGVEPTDG